MFAPLTPLFGEHKEDGRDTARFGEKGAYLHWLCARGESVPPGFVIEPNGVAEVLSGQLDALEVALKRLAKQLAPSDTLAIRASPTLSLPGALKSVLDVPLSGDHEATLRGIAGAVLEVVHSTAREAVREQLAAQGLSVPREPWVAVIVQRMVRVSDEHGFGLVAHSRSPLSGQRGLVGEYVRGRGARAVVSGQTRPRPLLRKDASRARPDECLEAEDPALVAALLTMLSNLEKALAHPVEVEAVFDGAALWLVEVRPAVLSARALIKTALDMLDEGAVPALALRQLASKEPRELIQERLAAPEVIGEARVIARGLAASPGVASGVLCVSSERVLSAGTTEALVVIRRDAVPEDVALFRRAKALVTTSGGLTSHAAVIARGLCVPATVGVSDLFVDRATRTVRRTARHDEVLLHEGDIVTVDAHRGILYRGALAAEPVVGASELRELLSRTATQRICPLWTIGPARSAMRALADCKLEGMLAHFDRADITLLAAVPWVLVEPEDLDQALTLPLQVGLCVSHARDVNFAALKARSPERRWGIAVGAADPPMTAFAYDLAIMSDGYAHSGTLSANVRLRLVDDFANGPRVSGHSQDGLLCTPEQAAKWALFLSLRD